MNPQEFLESKYKTIYDWALAYRRKGWNVVPLFNYTKVPSKIELWNGDDFGWLPGWKDLQTRLGTDKEFNHWFKELKPTGVGIITGKISNIFVVDEDSYKADGMKFQLASAMKSKTARGGAHHFFQYTEGIKTSGWKKGINIEIKSEGGFIVLPPSQVYTDDAKQSLGKYVWEKMCKIENLPVLKEADLKIYRDGTKNWTPAGFKDLLNVGEGDRHNALRTLALRAFNRFKQSEWDSAVDFIRNSAAKYDPPMTHYEVERIISDTMNRVKSSSVAEIDSEIKKFNPRTISEVASERRSEKELEKIAPKTGYPELDRIITGFVPGHLYTVTGNTNVGKSSIACNFAERIRRQGKKTLYFALEPENTVVDYLASVRTGKMFADLNDEDINYDDGNISIYGKQEIQTLDDLVNAVGNSKTRYDLIIVDHIGYFIQDRQNWIQEQSSAIKRLVGLAKSKKTAILIIAHLRKKSSADRKEYTPTADDISGSGAFKQDSTEVMIIVRPNESNDPDNVMLSNYGKLFVVKTKSGPNGVVDLVFATRKALIVSPEEVAEERKKEKATPHMDELTAMGFPDRGAGDV